jgi:hypothetical protein
MGASYNANKSSDVCDESALQTLCEGRSYIGWWILDQPDPDEDVRVPAGTPAAHVVCLPNPESREFVDTMPVGWPVPHITIKGDLPSGHVDITCPGDPVCGVAVVHHCHAQTVLRASYQDGDDLTLHNRRLHPLGSGTTVQLPTFGFTSLNTGVSVPDGGTVLLGGTKSSIQERNGQGTPAQDRIRLTGSAQDCGQPLTSNIKGKEVFVQKPVGHTPSSTTTRVVTSCSTPPASRPRMVSVTFMAAVSNGHDVPPEG